MPVANLLIGSSSSLSDMKKCIDRKQMMGCCEARVPAQAYAQSVTGPVEKYDNEIAAVGILERAVSCQHLVCYIVIYLFRELLWTCANYEVPLTKL